MAKFLPVTTESDFASEYYRMDYPKRGTAVIFNNEHFCSGVSPRTGTKSDANAVYKLLNTLGFEKIMQHENSTVSEMKQILFKVSKQDHSNSGCFVCVLLSYGEEGYVYGHDNRVAVDDLMAFFKGDKCSSLAMKPKLFFVQACPIRYSEVADSSVEADGSVDLTQDIRRIPVEADFLIAYSVIPGKIVWNKQSECRSWFIQALCDVFQENDNWKKLDLMTLLTRVLRENADLIAKKRLEVRIPCLTSLLTKNLFFSN